MFPDVSRSDAHFGFARPFFASRISRTIGCDEINFFRPEINLSKILKTKISKQAKLFKGTCRKVLIQSLFYSEPVYFSKVPVLCVPVKHLFCTLYFLFNLWNVHQSKEFLKKRSLSIFWMHFQTDIKKINSSLQLFLKIPYWLMTVKVLRFSRSHVTFQEGLIMFLSENECAIKNAPIINCVLSVVRLRRLSNLITLDFLWHHESVKTSGK